MLNQDKSTQIQKIFEKSLPPPGAPRGAYTRGFYDVWNNKKSLGTRIHKKRKEQNKTRSLCLALDITREDKEREENRTSAGRYSYAPLCSVTQCCQQLFYISKTT